MDVFTLLKREVMFVLDKLAHFEARKVLERVPVMRAFFSFRSMNSRFLKRNEGRDSPEYSLEINECNFIKRYHY